MDDRDKRTGVGRALRRAVGYEEVADEDKVRSRGIESVLMNPTRQRVFQFLCDRPCSHLRLVARSLHISTPTADWHLKRLVRSDFVGQQVVGKKKVYYPKDLIAPDDIITLSLLNEDLPRRIIAELKETPGLSQKALKERIGRGAMSRCLGQMQVAGIIDGVISGRFTHHFIHKALLSRDKDYSRRMKQFRKALLKRLEKDGLSPRIVTARENLVEIEVQSGAEKGRLTIRTRPFAFMMSSIK